MDKNYYKFTLSELWIKLLITRKTVLFTKVCFNCVLPNDWLLSETDMLLVKGYE